MATLEEKIKALLEGKDSEEALTEEQLAEGASEAAVALKQAAHGLEQAADALSESESDDDEDDDQEDGYQTAVAQDKGEVKEAADLEEGTDPFGSLDGNGGDSSGDAGKNAKLKSGLSKKDNAGQGKLTNGATPDKQDDAGLNSKLKVGMSKTESGGKLSDGTTGSGTDETNAKNAPGTELQKGAVKNPVSEHMDALFSGEELSEEFKTKASTIFEAAVEQAAATRVAELQEEYQQRIDEDAAAMVARLDEAVEEAKSELVEQIDGFLNYMVEQWTEDNAVALEGAMKVELVNSFIDGMKGLFKEHYFEIPEDKLNIVEEQAKEIEELKTVLADLSEEHDALVNEKVELTKSAIQEEVADELTETEKEKFAGLVESFEFTSEEEYKEKLETIKESYFPKSKGESAIPTDDTPAPLTEETVKRVDSYVDAIAKNLKF